MSATALRKQVSFPVSEPVWAQLTTVVRHCGCRAEDFPVLIRELMRTVAAVPSLLKEQQHALVMAVMRTLVLEPTEPDLAYRAQLEASVDQLIRVFYGLAKGPHVFAPVVAEPAPVAVPAPSAGPSRTVAPAAVAAVSAAIQAELQKCVTFPVEANTWTLLVAVATRCGTQSLVNVPVMVRELMRTAATFANVLNEQRHALVMAVVRVLVLQPLLSAQPAQLAGAVSQVDQLIPVFYSLAKNPENAFSAAAVATAIAVATVEPLCKWCCA